MDKFINISVDYTTKMLKLTPAQYDIIKGQQLVFYRASGIFLVDKHSKSRKSLRKLVSVLYDGISTTKVKYLDKNEFNVTPSNVVFEPEKPEGEKRASSKNTTTNIIWRSHGYCIKIPKIEYSRNFKCSYLEAVVLYNYLVSTHFRCASPLMTLPFSVAPERLQEIAENILHNHRSADDVHIVKIRSQYKSVYYNVSMHKWIGRIFRRGGSQFLGAYDFELDARDAVIERLAEYNKNTTNS